MDKDKPSKTSGTIDEMKGKANQAIGSVTDNPERQLKGQEQERSGEHEKERAEVRKNVENRDTNRNV